MPITYELNFGDKWTIPLKQYENRSPMVNIKVVETTETTMTDEEIRYRLRSMSALVDEMLKEKRQEIVAQDIAETLTNVRFYDIRGKKYPSVTSIISMGEKPDIPNIDLYALRGDILHRIFAKMITDNELVYDLSDEEKKSLEPIGGLRKEEFDLSWILDQKYEFHLSETEVFNDEFMYAGRYDAKGFNGDCPVLFDLKSGTPSKDLVEKSFIQLSAYAKCLPEVKKLIILPVHPKSKKAPIVTEDIEGYFSKFLKKRAEFKAKFGI